MPEEASASLIGSFLREKLLSKTAKSLQKLKKSWRQSIEEMATLLNNLAPITIEDMVGPGKMEQ